MNLHGRATGRALLSDADNITAAGSLLKSRLAHRTSREEILATIHPLRNQGLTCSEIGRRTGFPRRSIAKWLQFETPPDRRRAALKQTSPWYFEDFLSQRWKDGIRTRRRPVASDPRAWLRGEPDAFATAAGRVAQVEKQANGPAVEHQILEPVRDPETGHAISPVIAAALCIKPRGKLSSDQARKVDALKAGSPDFATMRSLAMRFNGILRGREADPLPAWIDEAIGARPGATRALCPHIKSGLRCGQKRHRDAMEQRPSRRSDQSPEDAQTRHVRSSRSRIVARRMLPFHHTD